MTRAGGTLLLLHAFPLDHRMWDGVVAVLQVHGVAAGRPGVAPWRILAPDFRGFGSGALGGGVPQPTPGPLAPTPDLDVLAVDLEAPTPDLDVLAADLEELLDREGVEQAVVAGVSLGGYVAMALLRLAPARVRGLVLVDTKAGADPADARANRIRIADEMAAGADVRALARAMLPTLLGPTVHADVPATVELVRDWIGEADPAAIAWVQRAMAHRPDSVATLRGFAGPTAVVWGEEDAVAGWAEQVLMAEALGVEVDRIPAAGHLTPVEAPEGVATAIERLLAACATETGGGPSSTESGGGPVNR